MPKPVFALLAATAALIAAAPAGTASPEIYCTGSQGPNPAMPEVYQRQYNGSIADSVIEDLTAYHAAIEIGDNEKIIDAATSLENGTRTYPMLLREQTYFGCYSQSVLENLREVGYSYGDTLTQIFNAAPSSGAGSSSVDLSNLVAQAKPRERAYINALNAYADQFGGKHVPLF